MHLRALRPEDAAPMLSWMHDPFVVAQMGTNFGAKTMADCLAFIESSRDTARNLHFAIADEADAYMGTVSLKHINREKGCAEFAITVCREAMGKGYSRFGMSEILRYGFHTLGLRRIYWYVSRKNARAIRFYEKNGYGKITDLPPEFTGDMTQEQIDSMLWFAVEA